MLTGEIAKYQIQDRVRAAEHDRAAASIRVDRDRGRTGIARRAGSGLLAVISRRRKVAPSSTAIDIRVG
jgi:hypothetical protein